MNKQPKTEKTEKEKKNVEVKQVNTKKKVTDKPVKYKNKKADKIMNVINVANLESPKYKLTRTSLVVVEQMTEDEFMELGNRLHKVNVSIQWWIGDWLNIAKTESKYKENQKIQEKIKYMKLTCLVSEYSTLYSDGYLSNIAWVCSRIEPSRRREKLSFSHHQEVASLSKKEQEYWLDKAEEKHYCVKGLRGEITKAKKEESNKNLKKFHYCVYESENQSKLYSYESYFDLCERNTEWLIRKLFYLKNFSAGYFEEYYDSKHEISKKYLKDQVSIFRFNCKAILLHLNDLFEILNKYINDKILYDMSNEEYREKIKQCIKRI